MSKLDCARGCDLGRRPRTALYWPLMLLLAAVTCPLLADETRSEKPQQAIPDDVSAAQAASSEEEVASDAARSWGIEITSIRLSANDHMIDYRYKVLDAQKATDLFARQIKPHLIHQDTQKVLSVPETAKLGPLRNSNTPQQGRIYWMFFGNAGKLVKPGDKVTVVIGDFRVEDLVVN